MIIIVMLVLAGIIWLPLWLGTRSAKKSAERTANLYGWASLTVARKALHMGPMMPYKKMEQVLRDHAAGQGGSS